MKLTLSCTSSDKPIEHSGVPGMRWGVRRYQNKDGSLTEAGKKRYLNSDGTYNKKGKKFKAKMTERELNQASYERGNAQAKRSMHEQRLKYSEYKAKHTTDRWKVPKYENDAKIAKTKMREMEMHISKADRKIATITDRIKNDPDLTYHVMNQYNEGVVSGYRSPKKDGYSLSTRIGTYKNGIPVTVYDGYSVKSTDSRTGKMYNEFGTNTKQSSAKLRYK